MGDIVTETLYLDDSYGKEFDAKVIRVDGNLVILDRTLFYPSSGGQPNDTGVLHREENEFNVVDCKKIDGEIQHILESHDLMEGDIVHGIIDWERRYKLMRMHSAAHVISYVFDTEASAKITGNQLDIEQGRIDYNLDEFDKEKIQQYFDKANNIVKEDYPLEVSYVSVEEAKNMPGLFKLANKMPPDVEKMRIVSIGNLDKQADGGTHVHSTKEIGNIVFVKASNKGKNNRRVYFRIE
ncbi:MAG: alanyl-tRNA editing protein AlaXM [Candidatus Woesearchaeota archaeon]